MKKKSRFIKTKIISIAVFVLLALLYFIIGNYFYNYTLAKNEKTFMENNSKLPDNTVACETFLKSSQKEWLDKVDKKDEEIRSFDNLKLTGTSFLNKESKSWVIIVHGYFSNKTKLYDRAQFFFESGYNVLSIDLRACGKSEGNFVTMGWFERKDLIRWTQKISKEYPNSEIVLYGVSMGGATVMMASGETDLPLNVKCVIEDCGYKDVNSIFEFQLKSQFNLPSFPVIDAFKTVSKIYAKFNINEASSFEQIKKAKLPIMFIHGTKDNFVPFDDVNVLYNDYKGNEKEIYIVEDAGHNQAFKKNPEKYMIKVLEFCKKNIKMYS